LVFDFPAVFIAGPFRGRLFLATPAAGEAVSAIFLSGLRESQSFPPNSPYGPNFFRNFVSVSETLSKRRVPSQDLLFLAVRVVIKLAGSYFSSTVQRLLRRYSAFRWTKFVEVPPRI